VAFLCVVLHSSPPDLNISEELVRLNRRGSGTGLLWSRIVPAALLLMAAGAAVLSLGSHTPSTVAANVAQLPALASQPVHPTSPEPVLTTYAQLPLMFEANQGQTDPRVKFVARGSGYGLFLTSDEAVLTLHRPSAKYQQPVGKASVVRMKLAGGKTNPELQGSDLLPGKSNYLIGKDPSKWQRGVPQYARVRYSQVYPGVDLIYYGKQGELEYDFQIAPGSDPKKIQLQFEGSRHLKLDGGDLVLQTADGNVRLQAPHVYQSENGTEKPVEGRFVRLAEERVGFEVGSYDRSRALVIDPVLSYSSFLGGSGSEIFPTVAVDPTFSFYVTGSTTSTDFPIAGKPYQGTFKAGAQANVFVSKFDPTGATLVYSTYLGGTGLDTSAGIAVDAAGNAYIAGTTTSGDFPTQNAFAATPKAPGTHAFVSELDPDGTNLKYSTYLSGSLTDTTSAMTVDNKGLIYVIGITNSTDFPNAGGSLPGQSSLRGAKAFFVSKVDPTTTGTNSLVFSTYFGGGNPTNGTVAGGGIAVDNSVANNATSNIYITGGTNYLYTGTNGTTDFPIANAFQSCLDTPPGFVSNAACPTNVTAMDAFIAKFNPGTNTGAQLAYNTYLGGPGDDIGYGIGLDASGNAYITGSTNSPTTNPSSNPPNPFPPCTAGGSNGNTLSAQCLNRLPPTIGLEPCLNSPTGKYGSCPNSDTTHTDGFVAKINNPVQGVLATNLSLTYWSYVGGSLDDVSTAITVDGIQGARVVGNTTSTDLPILNPITPEQSTLIGTQNLFAARFDTLSSATTSSQFLTYLGGSGADSATGIALDSNANMYLTGVTNSANFPLATPFQGTLKGTQDAFIAKIGPKLAFTLTATPPANASVNAGNQVSFLYQVTNTGDTAASVGFQDNLGGGSGSAPATFVSASATGGTCPPTTTNNTILCNLGIINGGTTSGVSVTINLTPTGPGTISNSGTLLVVGTPFSQTVASQPVLVNSYTIAAIPVTPIVVAGQPATYQITLTPNATFTANISLACSAGLPGGTPAPACTFSTTPVTLAGSSPSTVTLTISTTARTTTTVQNRPPMGPFYATVLPISGLAFLGLGIGGRVRGKRRLLVGLGFLALMTLLFLQPACSGSSSSTTTTGTPAGTYTITVTATSGSFSQTVPITLVVQ
jgi:hypothetical protein